MGAGCFVLQSTGPHLKTVTRAFLLLIWLTNIKPIEKWAVPQGSIIVQ